MQPEIYAIDFGTTHSLLAAASPDTVYPPIPLEPGRADPTLLRTLLYFPDADHCYYGADAIDRYVEHGLAGRFIRSIKKHLPSRAFVGTEVDGRPLNLEDLVAAFLREMRRRANAHFGTEVDRVLLGRPARFAEDDATDLFAEQRLERAARLAGFREVHFCPEPVAAARDFAAALDQPRTVLIADFGGGTSDFTVVRMRRDAWDPSDVLSIGGLSVAGDALDGSLMRVQVAKHFGADVTYTVPMGNNVMRMPPSLMEKLCSPADLSVLREKDAATFLRNVQRWSLGEDDRRTIEQLFTLVEDAMGFAVFEEIEKAKRVLSGADHAEFRFEYPTIDIQDRIERSTFEAGASRPLGNILSVLDDVIERAGLTHADIELVCCTGGTARVPKLAEAITERFGRERMHSLSSLHSVIGGLAERAQALL